MFSLVSDQLENRNLMVSPGSLGSAGELCALTPRNHAVQIRCLRQSGQDVRFDHQQLSLRRGRRRKGAIGDGDHQLAAWNHNDQLAVQSYGAVARRRLYRRDPPEVAVVEARQVAALRLCRLALKSWP